MFFLWQIGLRGKTYPYMLPGWSAEKMGGSSVMSRSGTPPGWKRYRGGESATRISNELRPPDPGGGDVRLTTSRADTFSLPEDTCGRGSGSEEHVRFSPIRGLVERPMLRQQSDGQHIGAVKVSAVLVDVSPELVEEPVPTDATGDDGDTKIMSPLVWQAVLGNDLSMKEEVVPGVDCYDSVVGEPTSACLDSASGFVDLAGGVTIGMTSPADLAGGVTVGVTSLADAGLASPADLAGGVTVGVAYLTVAGVASLADAGVASLVDLAGGVTIGVTSLVGARVASLADAGVASLTDAGVASLTDAGVASLADAGVASLAVAGVASLADVAEVASLVSGNVTGSVTFLPDPVSMVTNGMTFWDRCSALDGSVSDYDDYCDDSPDYFIMNRVVLMVTLMCMGLLDRMSMSCVMIFMDWITVGRIVCL